MGKADEIAAKYASRHADFAEVLDCSGMCVLPGLVDGHTHPVFAGDRVHEFAMKVKARALARNVGEKSEAEKVRKLS